MKKILLSLMLLFFSFPAGAKLFKSSYVSFELPPNWSCKQEGFENVCVNSFSKKAKEAIIILTAKKRGPVDTLKNYQAHMKKEHEMVDSQGMSYKSKVKSLKLRKINGVDWIDSLKLGSEVKTYYTRYTATVKDSLGILVTFSAHKDHFSKYSGDFIKAVQSLKVIAPKELSQLGGNFKLRNKSANIFTAASINSMPDGISADLIGNESKSGLMAALGKKGLIGILLLLIVALGAFIYLKSR